MKLEIATSRLSLTTANTAVVVVLGVAVRPPAKTKPRPRLNFSMWTQPNFRNVVQYWLHVHGDPTKFEVRWMELFISIDRSIDRSNKYHLRLSQGTSLVYKHRTWQKCSSLQRWRRILCQIVSMVTSLKIIMHHPTPTSESSMPNASLVQSFNKEGLRKALLFDVLYGWISDWQEEEVGERKQGGWRESGE